jgi:hypothetical protein
MIQDNKAMKNSRAPIYAGVLLEGQSGRLQCVQE